LPNASVDAALLNEVLEHTSHDEAATLREIRRVLRPGGHLVVMSPKSWFPSRGTWNAIPWSRFRLPHPAASWLPGSWSARVMAARNYWPLELRDIRGDGQGFAVEEVDYVLPVFELYRWLPAGVISAYRRLMRGSRRPPLRKFGVSTLIVATRPFD